MPLSGRGRRRLPLGVCGADARLGPSGERCGASCRPTARAFAEVEGEFKAAPLCLFFCRDSVCSFPPIYRNSRAGLRERGARSSFAGAGDVHAVEVKVLGEGEARDLPHNPFLQTRLTELLCLVTFPQRSHVCN